MFWLRYLSNKATSICNRTGGSFSPVLRKWESSLVSITSWLLTNFLVSIGIQNNFARTRYQEVLQNNHFSENTKQDKTDKGHQIRTVHHLNKSFQVVFSNKTDQVLMSIWQNSKDFPVSCPNIIRFYNNGMDGYKLDRKSKHFLYLRMLFDLIDVTHVSSHMSHVYIKLRDGISLLPFIIVVAKALIGRYSNRKRSFPNIRLRKWKSHEPSMPRQVPTHMPEFQYKQMRCHFCKNEGSHLKFFFFFLTCKIDMLGKREELFFEAPFVVLHHDLIAYYIPFRK